ncbi:MAG TPA: helix-turn-helix domain-containing protein [Victivallales bacterium]|nr:helix-turn-helix domain-containing protein [Victivallales bacterium]
MFNFKKLKELRKHSNISAAVLARRVGVSASAIRKWESGERVPKDMYIRRIADIFDLPIHLISNLDDRAPNLDKITGFGKDWLTVSHKGSKIAQEINDLISKLKILPDLIDSTETTINALMTSSSILIYIKDGKGVYLNANRGFMEAIGMEYSTPIRGHYEYDIKGFGKNAHDNHIEDMKILSGIEPAILNKPGYILGSNKKKHALISKAPIYSKTELGKIAGLVAVYIDVTELVQTKQKLEDNKIQIEKINNQQNRLITYFKEYFPDGVIIRDWDMSTDNPVYTINQKRLDIWGVNMDIINNSPETWRDMIHPLDKRWVIDMHDNKKGINGEFRIIDGHGKFKWISEVTVTKNDKLNRKFTISINRDITEVKEKELLLDMLKAFLNEDDNAFYIAMTIERKINKILYSSSNFNKYIYKETKRNFNSINQIEQIINSKDLDIFKNNKKKAFQVGKSNCFCKIKTGVFYTTSHIKFLQKSIQNEKILTISIQPE